MPSSSNSGRRLGWIILAGSLIGLALAGAWLTRRQTPAPPPAQPATQPDRTTPMTAPAPTATLPAFPRPTRAPLDRFPGWTNAPSAGLIRELLDGAQPLAARRQAALALARLGSNEALAALKTALLDGPPYLKAMIGEGLGESPHPDAQAMILGLIQDPDEVVARGAVRGLGARGTTEAAQTLQDLLFDPNQPASVRAEAALTLGDVPQPEALGGLSRALNEIDDPDLVESVLKGLGKRPFSETQEFFRSYLETPNLASESKVTALEALSATQGEVAPFLLSFAGDSDPEVRRAAIWALGNAENPTDISPRLFGLLKQETDPEIRARLYETLKNQDTLDASQLLAAARNESAPTARVAALSALASVCRTTASEAVLNYFNETAVPELKTRALTAEDKQGRLAALAALSQAATRSSLNALQEIAAQPAKSTSATPP